MIKKFFVVVALLVLTSGFAQDGSVSPYSYFGTGDVRFKGMVENRLMGGMTIFADSIHLNLSNPAALGKLRLTTFAAAGSNSSLTLKTENGSESAGNVSFDYVALGFPLAKRLAVQFGVLPYSTVKYNLQNLDESISPAELWTYNGNGGLNKVFLSAGWGITPNLSIGATANYNFGSIERTSSVRVEEVMYSTRQLAVSDFSGWDYNLALHYQGKLSDNLEFQSAFTYSPETQIDSKNLLEISTIFVNANGGEIPVERNEIDLEADGLDNTTVNRPHSYTAGLGVGKPFTWFLGGQYEFAKNSDFEMGFTTGPQTVYEDASRISVGGFWIPDYSSLTSYWKRVTYRLGVRSEDTGLMVNGSSLKDFGMTLGVGLPMGGFSNANVGVEVGKRGETFNGGLQENYVNVYISLSLNDRWFLKNLIR